jgi:hypothetical protein
MGAKQGNHNAQGHHNGHHASGAIKPVPGKASVLGATIASGAFGGMGALAHGAINGYGNKQVRSGAHAAGGFVHGAVSGAVGGGLVGGPVGAVVGAPVGAAIGATTGYVGSKIGKRIGGTIAGGTVHHGRHKV